MLDLDSPAGADSGLGLDTDDLQPARSTRGGNPRRSAITSRSGTGAGAASPAEGGRASATSRTSRTGAVQASRTPTLGGQGKASATSRSGQLPAAGDPGRPSATSRTSRTGLAPASRTPTLLGPGIGPGKASATSRSGQLPAAAAGSNARSGTMRAVRTASAPLEAPDPSTLTYGRGMMLDDNPFNDAFSGSAAGAPSLELANDAQQEPEQESAPPPPEESPAQKRARAIVQLAGYGAAPTRVLEQPLYWYRVMNRKRALSVELVSLSIQRKRADDQAQEALAKLGEELSVLSEQPELAALAKLFAAVEDAEDQIGQVAAESQKRHKGMSKDLARLGQDLKRLEAKAAPLRQREAEIAARVDELKAQARRADTLRRKADAELEALRAKGGDVERWGALTTERDARLGEFQTLGIQLGPLEDDLGGVRRELAQYTRNIASAQDEKRTASGVLERAQHHHRISAGSARGARQQALISLASAALKLGLHEVLPEWAQAATEAAERVEKKRQQEELQRAAVQAYDHEAYRRGFAMLMGSVGLLFVSLAIAVLF